VRFLTGHQQNNEDLAIDWNKVADPDCTLVIYMGLTNLQSICNELINAGLPASTPAAAIQDGSTRQQRKVIATLADLAETVARSDLKSPVTTIVGKVVALSAELDWFQGDEQQDEGVDYYDSIKLARA